MKNIVLFDASPNASLQLQEVMIAMGQTVKLVQNIREIFMADGIILYGKGSFANCKNEIESIGIDGLISQFEMPVLGISIGMQIMGTYCLEGDKEPISTEGFSIFSVRVNEFGHSPKFIHSGMDSISSLRGPLFEGVEENAEVYFHHSTKMLPSKNYSTALCVAGETFSASIQKDNYYGVEFFPEHSGETGITVLQNFINLL